MLFCLFRKQKQFFKYACEFSGVCRNGENVVEHLISLVRRVHKLKAKTTCLRTDELSTASKVNHILFCLNKINVYFDHLK